MQEDDDLLFVAPLIRRIGDNKRRGQQCLFLQRVGVHPIGKFGRSTAKSTLRS